MFTHLQRVPLCSKHLNNQDINCIICVPTYSDLGSTRAFPYTKNENTVKQFANALQFLSIIL